MAFAVKTMFARKPYVRPARPALIPRSEPARAVLRRADGKDRITVSAPKGVKAKPGKGKPTKAEAEWMDRIVEHGCVACRAHGYPSRPTAVHHILRGGRRIGHLFTLPLCDPGHHQNGKQLGLVSRHPDKAKFELIFGTELELLAKLKVELGVFDEAEYS